MAAPPSTAPIGAVAPTPSRATVDVRGTSWPARLTSVPVLAIGLIVATMIAAGPMQVVDERLNHRWIMTIAPAWNPFLQEVLDRVAGQAVCLPVLATVAIVLAWRRRSWRPILFAAAAEAAFYLGIGGLKFLLARPSPTVGDAEFLRGGFLEFGEMGISFPSGHASEAVLIYGAAVFLIHHYSSASARTVLILRWVVAAITVNSVAVSFLLGWHWASDLVGGVLAGGLFLRILSEMDLKAQENAAYAAASATDQLSPEETPHADVSDEATDEQQPAGESPRRITADLEHSAGPVVGSSPTRDEEDEVLIGPVQDGHTTWRDVSETLSQ